MKLSEAVRIGAEYVNYRQAYGRMVQTDEYGDLYFCVLGCAYYGLTGKMQPDLAEIGNRYDTVKDTFPILKGGRIDRLWKMNDSHRYSLEALIYVIEGWEAEDESN